MKPEIECLRCILSVRLREIEQTSLSKKEKLDLARELIARIEKEFCWEIELTKFASEFFKFTVLKAPSIVEFYRSIKQVSNRMALENLSLHTEYVSKLRGYDRFKYLVKLSAMANLIDYGVADHKPLEQGFLTPGFVEKYETYIDDSYPLYNTVSSGGLKILWLFDNAGEAVYDILLIKELKSMGNKVYALVKDEPGFQNDVTIDDIEYLGISKLIDEILTYERYHSTIHLESLSNEALTLINNSDIVIAKGMSHFEYLSEVNLRIPLVFILVPKCNPVAKVIGRDSQGKIVVMFKQSMR